MISYVLFIYVGIRKHGFVKYMKHALVPPAPWFILPLLVPIEFFSTFIVRPFTLAVRLFANMFAGHMILLVFTPRRVRAARRERLVSSRSRCCPGRWRSR